MCFTRQRQHGLKLLAVCDAGASLGTGLPQVLIVPHRRDHLIRKRRGAPRIIHQRHEGEQPASQTHQEPQHLNPSRHDRLTQLKSTQYPRKHCYESTAPPADRLPTTRAPNQDEMCLTVSLCYRFKSHKTINSAPSFMTLAR